MLGKYGPAAQDDATDPRWNHFSTGTHELVIEGGSGKMLVRMLNSAKDGINPPSKLFLFVSEDGQKWSLYQMKNTPVFPNTNHDAFIDYVLFEDIPQASYMKLAFTVDGKAAFDSVVTEF